jgi:hypothetical protein
LGLGESLQGTLAVRRLDKFSVVSFAPRRLPQGAFCQQPRTAVVSSNATSWPISSFLALRARFRSVPLRRRMNLRLRARAWPLVLAYPVPAQNHHQDNDERNPYQDISVTHTLHANFPEPQQFLGVSPALLKPHVNLVGAYSVSTGHVEPSTVVPKHRA